MLSARAPSMTALACSTSASCQGLPISCSPTGRPARLSDAVRTGPHGSRASGKASIYQLHSTMVALKQDATQQQGIWQHVILPTQAGCLLMMASTWATPVGSASPTGTEAAGCPVMLHRNVNRIMAPVTGRLLSPLASTSSLHSTGAVGLSFHMLQSRALQEPWALNESCRLKEQLCLGWCHACQPSLAGCREGLHIILRLVHCLPTLCSRRPQERVPPGLPRC